MQRAVVLKKVVSEVKRRLSGEGSGHDWWHVWRVWQIARRIGRKEGGNLFVIELAALVHEIGDAKISGGRERHDRVERVLTRHGVAPDVRDHVMDIIRRMSFRDNIAKRHILSLEGKIVQDADRLDALGAIGIARAFAFGGKYDRLLYDPNIRPRQHTTKRAYTKHNSTTVNHFYEKLLLLKDRMNTRTAKRIAQERYRLMLEYLQKFFQEWEGKA